MKYENKIYLSVAWIIIGAALIVLSCMEIIDSAMCSGFGGGLVGVGIVQTIRHLKYAHDPEYKENFDIEVSDERNKYIRMKAWSWAGYLFVMAAALGTIIFAILGNSALMQCCSYGVCITILFYWVSYLILQKKY